jgi:hypothetical protein
MLRETDFCMVWDWRGGNELGNPDNSDTNNSGN